MLCAAIRASLCAGEIISCCEMLAGYMSQDKVTWVVTSMPPSGGRWKTDHLSHDGMANTIWANKVSQFSGIKSGENHRRSTIDKFFTLSKQYYVVHKEFSRVLGSRIRITQTDTGVSIPRFQLGFSNGLVYTASSNEQIKNPSVGVWFRGFCEHSTTLMFWWTSKLHGPVNKHGIMYVHIILGWWHLTPGRNWSCIRFNFEYKTSTV